MQTDWVLASSDTRRILLDQDTGEKTVVEESSDKAKKLTKNVLISTGGSEAIGQTWKEYMETYTSEEFFLDDCEQIFEDSIEVLLKANEDNEAFKKFFKTVGLYLIGFNRDGTTGFLKSEYGTIYKETIVEGTKFNTLFSPTKDIWDKRDAFFDYSQLPMLNNNWLDSILNRFALIQAVVSKMHPTEVSTKLIAHILMKNSNGEIEYIQTDYDLQEFQSKL